MFSSNLAESKEKEIGFRELDSDALENLINYAYTNQIKITTENAESLLIASEFLQVIQIRDSCCDFLSKMLDSDNVMHIRSLAHSLNCSSLVENSDRYIRQHFDEFSMTKDFISLPFPFLNDLIRRDDLYVTSEEKVFEAIMTWAKIDPTRQNALPELLSGIRMTHFTLEFLIKKASREKLIIESIPCRNLLDEAKHFHILPEERAACSSFSQTERRYKSQDDMYLFCCNTSTGLTILKYISLTGEWSALLNDKERHDVQNVIGLGDQIYVFRSNNFEKFNPLTLEWAPQTKFPDTGSQHKYAVPCCNMIYCLQEPEECCFFDPNQNKWFDRDLPVLISNAEVVSSGTEIYVLQSYMHPYPRENYVRGQPYYVQNSGNICDWCYDRRFSQRYNPQTLTVSNIPEMSNPSVISFGCAALDDKIYVCGGLSDNDDGIGSTRPPEPLLKTAEVYSPSDGHWRSICEMNTGRTNFSMISYNKKLYAFGGNTECEADINSIECYNPVSDKWTLAGSFSGEYSFVKPVVISTLSQ